MFSLYAVSRSQCRRNVLGALKNRFCFSKTNWTIWTIRPHRNFSTQKNREWLSLKKEIYNLTEEKKYNEACALFQSIGKKVGNRPAPYLWAEIGRTLSLMKENKGYPTVDAFNTLIDLTSVSTNDFEEVIKILDSMDFLQIRPDTNTFNNLIYAMIENNKFQFGSRILFKMKTANVSLKIDTLNLLIQAYADKEDHDTVIKLIGIMETIEVEPDDTTGMIIQKYYGKNENHRCAVAFKNLLKEMDVNLTSPLPELEDEFDHYYAHFPKAKFDDEGNPIIPEEFQNYKDFHTPHEDGTFPWEMQGSAKDIEIKPWRDPPIKTVADFEKWYKDMEENKKKVATADLLLLFDFESLKKEIGERFDLEKMKGEVEMLKTPGLVQKYWLEAFAGLEEDLKKELGEDSFNKIMGKINLNDLKFEDPITETVKDPSSSIKMKKQNKNEDVKEKKVPNAKIETESWIDFMKYIEQQKKNSDTKWNDKKEPEDLWNEFIKKQKQTDKDVKFDCGLKLEAIQESWNEFLRKVRQDTEPQENKIKEYTLSPQELKDNEDLFGKITSDDIIDSTLDNSIDQLLEKDKRLTLEEKEKLKVELKSHAKMVYEKPVDEATSEAAKNIWLYGRPTKPTKPIPEEYGWTNLVRELSGLSESEKQEWMDRKDESNKQEMEQEDRELEQFLRQNNIQE